MAKTGIGGTLLKEAKYINLSLHYLEQVIIALHEKATGKRSHIPYRNSMMTSVLRDSLGGNCKTTMVATCAVEDPLIDVICNWILNAHNHIGIDFYLSICSKGRAHFQ